MENRVENSDGVEIPKKKRSLDLKSLYKSRDSEEASDKKNYKILERKHRIDGVDDDSDGERRKKRKKESKSDSRKEVSVNSFEHVGKKSRKSLDELYCGGLSSGSGELEKTRLGLSQRLGNGSSTSTGLSQPLNRISLSLDDNVRIPKGRRGFARRKKFDGNNVSKVVGLSSVKESVIHQLGKVTGDSGSQVDSHSHLEPGPCDESAKVKQRKFDGDQVTELEGPSCGKDAVVDQLGKLAADSVTGLDSSSRITSVKVKRRRGSADTKDKKSRGSIGSLTVHNLKEDGSPIAHGDSSSRKSRKKHRKGMDVAADSQRFSKEAKPSVDNFDGLLEDDEENLEQNAARMLSSRFDPNCTSFSSDRKTSPSLLRNRLSLSTYSGPGFTSCQITSLASSESVSVDAAGMVLRPRKQHREKSLSRKRRHFYEILFTDIDADWVLNRRIKVFWPLDKSWYYGLVNDYDPERKLHHVKYDDRDEEWINLQNERFKLLLFPSEVPGKSGRKKLVLGDRYAEGEKGDMTMEDDNYLGSFMDSEPIISWLARSTHRVKSSPFGYLKKKKTSSQCPDNKSPVLSDKTVNPSLSLSVRHSKSVEKKTSNASSTVRFSDDREEKSVSGNDSLPRDVKLPIVYFRRRFRQRGQEHGHIVRSDHVCRSGPESVTPVERHETSEEHNITLELSHCSGPLWHIDNSGLLKLTIPVRDSRQFRFEISLPVIPTLHYLSRGETLWLFRTLLLLQYGAMITMWSNVHLEMLFVDNIVGLRFFSFEGCLQQAVAFIFFVLTVFLQRNEQGRYYDLQMPVTSVRFKLSCSHSFGKQLVFAFSNFCKVKTSKWLYLDFKLKRHCLIAKQLPLSECTYDNIEALQSGHNQLVLTTVCDPSSTEVLPKRFRQGTICTGASGESTSMNKSQFSCSYKERHRQIPSFSLSFTAAPTFFLGLHLKLLMERSVSHISFPDHDLTPSQGHANNSGRLIVEDGSLVDVCSNISSVITSGDSLSTSRDAACSLLSCVYPRLGANALAECSNVGYRKPSKYQNGHLNNAETSSSSQDNADDEIYDAVQWQSHHSESNQFFPRDLVIGDRSSPDRSGSGCHSRSVGISVDIPPFNQVENHVDRRTLSAHRSTTLAWNMNDGVIRSPNPTGPRTMWHRTRSISSSSSFGYLSNVWPDGKDEFYRNGFNSGPKKPRTQVSYTLPFGGVEFSSKHRTRSQQQKGIAHRRIRRANEKKTLDGSRSSPRNLESLSCDANVLITLGDRGWRECGARIVLEYVDRNEWRLAVKLSGSTKYSYKAHQFLQPGSANRYTHAMMWKGGKDWILEFPDRSQWTLFKEMHEECYNRNIRAASVKNIPIPGVHLIEESDDIETEMGFVRSSSKYFRQVETDVDLALDPSHILYDMDSDDEQWILENQSISDTKKSISGEISDELFEKIMDMFEKVAYSQQRDQFTLEEIEELMFGVGPLDLIKIMYDYWLQKRQRKGMPLIRQLQPPLWERYQQQIKDWEFATTKTNSALPNGCQEKAAVIEKPPMFAFCLKPRGLEVPNKGSKQRSHRKVPVSGQSNSIFGDHDGYHPFGRRINGFAFGDEKIPSPGYSHEFSEASPYFQTSRAFSPRDAGTTGHVLMSSDGFERNHHPKLHRTKSKKIGSFPSQNDPQLVGSFNQRTIGNRTGVHRWNMGLPDWPSHKNTQSDGPLRPSMEQLDGSVHDEFRLRDASGAAQHALNMAKLKREKAQRLLYRADLAIHKAVVALMTAEAIKASSEDSIGDG